MGRKNIQQHTINSALIFASLLLEFEYENNRKSRTYAIECLEVSKILKGLAELPQPEWLNRAPPQHNHMAGFIPYK